MVWQLWGIFMTLYLASNCSNHTFAKFSKGMFQPSSTVGIAIDCDSVTAQEMLCTNNTGRKRSQSAIASLSFVQSARQYGKEQCSERTKYSGKHSENQSYAPVRMKHDQCPWTNVAYCACDTSLSLTCERSQCTHVQGEMPPDQLYDPPPQTVPSCLTLILGASGTQEVMNWCCGSPTSRLSCPCSWGKRPWQSTTQKRIKWEEEFFILFV